MNAQAVNRAESLSRISRGKRSNTRNLLNGFVFLFDKTKKVNASPSINKSLRWSAIALAGVGFLSGLLQNTELAIEWWEVALQAGVLIAFTFLLPFTVDMPTYQGKITRADFFPLKRSWPVILFWLAVIAVSSFVGVFLRALFTGGPFLKLLVFVFMHGSWVRLLYMGKLKRWTSQIDKPV